MNDITIIIPTKNCNDTIKKCLESCKEYSVICIDKNSIDGTLDIIRKYNNVKLLKQKSSGIASARNKALKYVNTKYVMMLGSDNILFDKKWCETKSNKIEEAIKYMENKGWIGIGYLTLISNIDTYFDDCMDEWFYRKIKAGERKVIGTPCIYKTKILKKYMYDDKCGFCDDSDLGERLARDGYKQGIGKFWCYDIEKNDFKMIKKRFGMYGKSDKQFYKKYLKDWSIFRKIKSWMHPLRTEWMGFNLYYLPFYFIIVFYRYKGWIFD